MAKVLVIDDDGALLKALRLGLAARGHDVITATRGQDGLTAMAMASPDVVVLDLGLPDIDGLTVCRRIRDASTVPIIVLSATGTEERKVAALDGGADDYVTKPFGMAELEARIRASVRHRSSELSGPMPASVSLGPLDIDFVHYQVRLAGLDVQLTAKEFELLGFLARNAGRTCTQQMILRAVWGEGYSAQPQYLHAYVHRLRQKLRDPSGVILRTAPGIGYSLVVENGLTP